MTSALHSSALNEQIAAELARRRTELLAQLQAATGTAQHAGEQPPEVSDFKDRADEEMQGALREATLSQAADELGQVVAALRRLETGSYGQCRDCGEPIGAARLLAIPASPLCTSCQALHEHADAIRG